MNEVSKRFFRNTGLFPERIFDAELEKKLADYPKELFDINAILALFDVAFEKYKAQRDRLLREDEEHLEVHFLRPVFERLGYELGKTYDFRPGIRRSHFTRKVPDYVFFKDEKDFRAVEALKNSSDPDENHRFFQAACALGEVKKWSASLEGRPADQLDGYLLRSGVNWGILTNGRQWRLFHRSSSSHLIYYLEFNLEALLAAYDPDQGGIYSREANKQELLRELAPLYLFFSRGAFIPDQEGLCWLDRFMERTKEELASLEEDLSRRVYSALETISQGFFDYAKNNLSPDNEEDLALVYHHSLILLYRLLFLFYAESPRRGKSLLPVDQENYEPYSLIYMVEKHLRERRPETLAKEFVGFWEWLRSIFNLIDKGSPSLGIQAYNGKLFSDEAYPFLEQKKLSDWHLVDALKKLSLDDYGLYGKIRVDYSPLSIRQLGTIYEGLLEHRLINNQGKISLSPTSGERKETGSYYTPDYIVKYIVENTLGPLVENATPEEILSLKVLDPAMGSGHFLVEAVDFLGKALAGARAGEDEYTEEDLEKARREVVTRCIYGVDLNPLAVELAKLALWIHTAAPDKPLSFLENHLKCGNSLVGADPDYLWGPPPRKGKPEKDAGGIFNSVFKKNLSGPLSLISQIEAEPEETAAQVHEKERTYEKALEKLRPFKQVADAWIAFFFDERMSKNKKKKGMNKWKNSRRERAWADLLAWLSNPTGMKPTSAAARVACATGRKLSSARHFFHWQLEFPEVFFSEGRKSNPGFDAVMGNPPYGIRIDESEKKFIQVRFENGTPDSAAYFLELALCMTRQGGNFGMIVPKSIAFYHEWGRIRNILLSRSFPRCIMDVGIAFREVNYEEIVLCFSTEQLSETQLAVAVPLRRPVFEKEILENGSVPLDLMKIADVIIFRGVGPRMQKAIRQIIKNSYYLRRIVKSIFRGIYISDKDKELLAAGNIKFVNKVPDVKRYFISRLRNIDISPNPKWVKEANETMRPRVFLKVMRGRRLVAYPDADGKLLTTEKLVNIILPEDSGYSYYFLAAVINSPVPSFFVQTILFSQTTETSRVMDSFYSSFIPIPRVSFTTPAKTRKNLFEKAKGLYETGEASSLLKFTDDCLKKGQSDVVHDLMAHLAREMISLNNKMHEIAERFLTDLEGCGVFRGHAERGKQARSLRDIRSICSHLEGLRSHAQRVNFTDALAWDDKEAFKDLVIASLERAPRLSDILEVYARYSREYKDKYLRRESTDALIDQIVYRLYGLTKEEIETVEAWDKEGSVSEE